ncbi:MAG: bi-domain-containing oxidoreductase [Candidatus Aenigmatarchaeota archaeon]
MKQIFCDYKKKVVVIEEVPTPALRKGFILVKNHFSLISLGTERSKIEFAKSNIIEKALLKKDLAKEVIRKIRQEGLVSTYFKVKHRLEGLAPLGYSCAGQVIEVAEDVKEFCKNDLVACGGAEFANHAEFVSVPINLAVKVPNSLGLDEASFATLGSIALWGVRQASVAIGEKICVIGLGLIGQLTIQLIKIAGAYAFGIDISRDKVELAKELGVKDAVLRSEDIDEFTNRATDGFGFDAVIITASTNNNDPIVLAGKICRDRAKIVVVGDIKLDFPRKDFYERELNLIVSRSYGPGRYDPIYEEQGIDYPIGYVRWTEKKNMQEFLNLIAEKKVNVKKLISHRFSFLEAERIYNKILNDKESTYLGILFEYPSSSIITKKVYVKEKTIRSVHQDINIGFIGAGNFAQGVILPNLRKDKINLIGVATSRGYTAKSCAKRFGFKYATTEPTEILDDENINTIFIVTRHNTHAYYFVETLKRKKNIFLEKPLALNEKELKDIKEVYKSLDTLPIILVGFNRRFSPLAIKMKEEFKEITHSLIINIRVNAEKTTSWINDEAIGGGRIIGELCHFIDLLIYFTNSYPKKLTVYPLKDDKYQENIVVSFLFRNGAIANIVYTTKGDISLEKEYIEIFGGGRVFINYNFRYGLLYKNKKRIKYNLKGKGHKEELDAFFTGIKNGILPIPFEDIFITTLLTFKIKEKVREGGGEIFLKEDEFEEF